MTRGSGEPGVIDIKTRQSPYFSSQELAFLRKKILSQKHCLIFPTETFYALGGDATQSEVVSCIYKLKKRDIKLPLLVLVADMSMLLRHVDGLSLSQKRFLEKIWPSPLSIILPAKDNLANELNYQDNYVAFRMTSLDSTRELIGGLGVPLVGTSANLSGMKEVSKFNDANFIFKDKVDLYIDGGMTRGEKPSTLIKPIDKERFQVLRQGAFEFGEKKKNPEWFFKDFL